MRVSGASTLRLMRATLRHWKALFSIYVQDGLAYRASGYIWILTDLVTAATMPMVWIAASGGGSIRGFDGPGFVLYYLAMLLLTCFVTSHFMWEVAFEIKEGQLSTFLVRPISYFQFMFVRNLAWRCVRTILFAPMFVVLLWLYRGYLGDVGLTLDWTFWTSVLLGHLLSFTFVMAMAMLALFLQDATAVFELYYVPMLFLSGQLFPVALMPDWVRNLALVFPFYYTTGLPTEIVIGRLDHAQAVAGIGIQLVWIVVSYVAQTLLWRIGLRHYTGVGM